MNKEEIEKQLKLSKKQNNNERYDYLCSHFNAINYCIKLEKYTKQLQQANQKLQQRINIAIELKKQLEEKNKPQIFIDTQDMEERYAEGLYQDYLEEENKKYKTQQKEFIVWLENERNINPYDISDYIYENIINAILSKYEEIIG